MTDAQLAQLALMVADLRGAYEQAQQRVTELERLVAALQQEREALQTRVDKLEEEQETHFCGEPDGPGTVPELSVDLSNWKPPGPLHADALG